MTNPTKDPVIKPPFCPYSDCVSWRFSLLAKLGGASYWRCKKCGTEFPYDPPK
jgi:tRNA(Ile2) C34 agmatinyltransferase TiaS